MNPEQSVDVLQFRIDRVRKGPSNWTFWVAAFTAMNGLFSYIGEDVMILAGLVLPYVFQSAVWHLVFGALLAVVAYIGRTVMPTVLYAGLVIYLVDTMLAVWLSLWSGVAMHLVVLFFVSLSFGARKALEQKLERLRLSQAHNG